MDPKQVTAWLAVPTDLPDGDAGSILQMTMLARPSNDCVASRGDGQSFQQHLAHCAACRAWNALGQPAQLAGSDAGEWLCARLRALSIVAPVGTETWITAQAHVAGCPTCRAWLLNGLAWSDCQGVRLRLAGSYWTRDRGRRSRLGTEDYAWFGGEALLRHLERCLPCRQWCLSGTSCRTVTHSIVRCWRAIQPLSRVADHKSTYRHAASWAFVNPADVAHLQLCHGCQQELTQYLKVPGSDWLFEAATRFCMPYAEVRQSPVEATTIAQREERLAAACRRALAHRAVTARWQPVDDELDVRFPRRE